MFKNPFLPSRKNKLHLNNEGHSVNTASVNKHCLFPELNSSSGDVKNEWSYTSILSLSAFIERTMTTFSLPRTIRKDVRIDGQNPEFMNIKACSIYVR
jgi:hypothetical protein